MPSAVHYVGYVEEDETPEMIMKKFEELEKVVHRATWAFLVCERGYVPPSCLIHSWMKRH